MPGGRGSASGRRDVGKNIEVVGNDIHLFIRDRWLWVVEHRVSVKMTIDVMFSETTLPRVSQFPVSRYYSQTNS